MQAKKNKGFLFLVYGLYLKKKKKMADVQLQVSTNLGKVFK